MKLASSFPLLVIGGLIITVGDVVLKRWTQTDRLQFLIGGLVIWMIGSVFLAVSFRTQNIAVASLVYVLINIMSLSLVSWLVFHEPLTSRALLGVILGLVAVTLLELGA